MIIKNGFLIFENIKEYEDFINDQDNSLDF